MGIIRSIIAIHVVAVELISLDELASNSEDATQDFINGLIGKFIDNITDKLFGRALMVSPNHHVCLGSLALTRLCSSSKPSLLTAPHIHHPCITTRDPSLFSLPENHRLVRRIKVQKGPAPKAWWDVSHSVRPSVATRTSVSGPVDFNLNLNWGTDARETRAWLEGLDELRVLVLGKTGVGKSSLVNALVNANAKVGELEVGTTGVEVYRNTLKDRGCVDVAVEVAVWDTPGFFDVEGRTPAGVLRELAAKVEEFDVILYAQPATDRRIRLEDEQSISFVIQALTRKDGADIASRVVIALTFGNELDESKKEEIVKTKSKQVRALFEGAIANLGGIPNPDAAGDIPVVAIGARGGGWEGAVWSALVQRAANAALATGGTAIPFEVNWDGLEAAGFVTHGKPKPPPPPMELVQSYVKMAVGEFDNSAQRMVADVPEMSRRVYRVFPKGMPPGFGAAFILEICVEGQGVGEINQIFMLMPASQDTVMKSGVGSLDMLPDVDTLRRGDAEVEMRSLSTPGETVTYKFNGASSSFTCAKEGLTSDKLVLLSGGGSEANDDAFAAVLNKRPNA